MYPHLETRQFFVFVIISLALGGYTAASAQQNNSAAIPYLRLSPPRHILSDAQLWEGDQFPHTLSVVELNRNGYRYWGWYGLNGGRGIGLAMSNDLLDWTKYENNPLLMNARWLTVLAYADQQDPDMLYVAFTRDYETPTSYIMLGSTSDGIHIKEERILVEPVQDQRNQNPNLFRDPSSGRFYLTWYRGNDQDQFEIVSRSAAEIRDLGKAPEKVLIRSSETVAAPNLLYLETIRGTGMDQSGIYYLASEIYPHLSEDNPQGRWQVMVFVADSPDGDFRPVKHNPVLRGQRACLFQHIFNGRFYGYDCHLASPNHWILEEVEAPLPVRH